ncbi:hypothetical protein Tco_1407038 [Tanacetum coccineum]
MIITLESCLYYIATTRSVNNEASVIDAEPLNSAPPSQFTENIGDSYDAPSEKYVVNEARNRKLGKSLKATGKRKQIAESSGKETRQKARNVSSQASKAFEFPSAKELKDSIDCYWVVTHVTPSSWKQHLKNISLEKLCDIYDKAHMRQGREKDKAYANLEMRCNDALLVLEEKKQDRAAVVAKFVPYVATKLICSDEMDLLAKAALFHGRGSALEEVAALKEPFKLRKMPEVAIDTYAPLEVLLSKKLKSLHPKHAPSSYKPTSSKAPNPMS